MELLLHSGAAVQHRRKPYSERMHTPRAIDRCRAELQEKLERLQRIVEVIDREAQAAAAGEPGTVERAAGGMGTPGPQDRRSPRLAEAVSAGKIATRRRAMAGLRPVPYAVPAKS